MIIGRIIERKIAERLNSFFENKNTKIKLAKGLANPLPQKETLREEAKIQIPLCILKIFYHFLPAKCREPYEHLRCFPTLYPSREGLSGVRIP